MPDFKTDLSKIAVAESQKPLAHCKSWYLYPESSSYWQRQLSWLHPWILPGIYSGRICSLLVLHRKRFNRFCRNWLHFCRTTSFNYWCFESMIFYFHGFKTINTQRPMLSMIKFSLRLPSNAAHASSFVIFCLTFVVQPCGHLNRVVEVEAGESTPSLTHCYVRDTGHRKCQRAVLPHGWQGAVEEVYVIQNPGAKRPSPSRVSRVSFGFLRAYSSLSNYFPAIYLYCLD